MNKNAIAINLLLCAALGGLISYFSSILWLTASLWVFAALFINGSIAFHEDAQPSGFNNPDGTAAPEFAKGWGAFKFLAISVSVSLVAFFLGRFLQIYFSYSSPTIAFASHSTH